MNTESMESTSDHEILAKFLAELDESNDPQTVIERFCEKYPECAKEFRSAAEMHFRLQDATPPNDSEIPQRLGDFCVQRKISEGGMGVIYEAVQQPLNRKVAVKVIRDRRVSPEAKRRFLREQQILALLHQSHIVPVFAAGKEGPIQYFAMPYIKGATMHHLVKAAMMMSTVADNSAPSLVKLAKEIIDDKEQRNPGNTQL